MIKKIYSKKTVKKIFILRFTVCFNLLQQNNNYNNNS